MFIRKTCTNGHGKYATPDNETGHARFPLPSPPPSGEGAVWLGALTPKWCASAPYGKVHRAQFGRGICDRGLSRSGRGRVRRCASFTLKGKQMNINFTQEEFNYVLNTLAKRPFREVARLFMKLQQQASMAASAAQQSGETNAQH